MPLVVTALAREPIDALVWRATGGGPAVVEAAIEANPGVARLGAALPEGTEILIPELAATPSVLELVQLWS